MRLLVFAASLCLLTSMANASSLNDVQKKMLAYWLDKNLQFRLATETECNCGDDIRQMREVGPWGKPVPDFTPYVLTGDFRRNGQSDFAVVVTTQEGRGALVIFDGPFRGTATKKPAYVGALSAIKNMALFRSQQNGWPIFGRFESEGCLYRPRGRTYIRECDF
jgi:hypothetical protein